MMVVKTDQSSKEASFKAGIPKRKRSKSKRKA